MSASDPSPASARWAALIVPTLLLAGAYVSEYVGHLVPCEMCWWQRYVLFVAVPLAAVGLIILRPAVARTFTALAALGLLAGGVIGLFHAGVENKWWPGLTHCSVPIYSGRNFLADVMATPLVRCDEAQWRFIGISLAGWNAIISIPFGLWILWKTLRDRR